MRAVFFVGSLLVTLAGLQLFVGTDHTDKYFAWTIQVPLTAAFLGAFYFTALSLALPSGFALVWARARVGVPGVVLFLWLTLLATLLHLGLFHLHAPGLVSRTAAWLWLIVYVLAPPAATLLWIAQLRTARGVGVDPPRAAFLPRWLRALLAVQGVIVLGVGGALFVTPGTATHLWPWALTPLTAQAMSAWMAGLGVVLLTAVWENDWTRVRPALFAYVGLGALQGIALARYGDLVRWGQPSAWLYVAVLASILAVGIYGLLASRGTTALDFPRSGAIS
ncbi:MAG: hypothetical protein M3Q23_11615 [Actinomycetota bacterium]|nr:hypothetical protein [Actinomycetota bacterium]